VAVLTMTVGEAALALGISRNSAYALARSGQLPVVRLGKRLLVSRSALERMLAQAGRVAEKEQAGAAR